MKSIFLTRGIADAHIVIPKNAAPVEQTAAKELNEYFKKSLDITLPIVAEGEETGKCIYIGKTAYAATACVVGTHKEHWLIHMHEDSLILTGGKDVGDRGIMYAVYHFLEDLVGVRWWDAYTEDVLQLDELVLDAHLHKEGIPVFPYRKPYMDSHAGIDRFAHLPRTRTNILSPYDDEIPQSVYDPDVRKYGDISYMGRPHHVHVMNDLFPKAETFKEHPEWLGYNRQAGERVPTGHFCLTNEEFINAIYEKYDAIMTEDVALAEKTGVELPYFYSVSLDDISNTVAFCQCESCAKVIEKSGYSGYVVQFTNSIARRAAKKFPHARFETLAYVCYIEPPKDDTVPESNVIIRIAANTIDISHGATSPVNKTFLRRLQRWTELCSKTGAEVLIWQYLYNQEFNYPLPLFLALPDLLRTLRKYGAKGIFTETQNSIIDCWELNKFMLTHLLEDPDLDEKALIKDFCHRFYGKAGPYVEAYFGVLREALERNPVHAYMSREDSAMNYIDSTAVIAGARALDLATEALGDEQPYRARLNWLRKPLDGITLVKYFDLKRQAAERGEPFDFDRARLKARVTAALEEHLAGRWGNSREARHKDEITYYNALSDIEEIIPIPEALKDVHPRDLYQYAVADMPRFGEAWIRRYFCFEIVEDPRSPVSRVLKMRPDEIKGTKQARFYMYPTESTAETPVPLQFYLLQNDEKVTTLALFKEDLPKDNYSIIKIGTLEGIKTTHDSLFVPYEIGVFTLNISGLATVFPMDACDVYVSMRYEGPAYGGNPEEENAVFIDRVIVHRRK